MSRSDDLRVLEMTLSFPLTALWVWALPQSVIDGIRYGEAPTSEFLVAAGLVALWICLWRDALPTLRARTLVLLGLSLLYLAGLALWAAVAPFFHPPQKGSEAMATLGILTVGPAAHQLVRALAALRTQRRMRPR